MDPYLAYGGKSYTGTKTQSSEGQHKRSGEKDFRKVT